MDGDSSLRVPVPPVARMALCIAWRRRRRDSPLTATTGIIQESRSKELFRAPAEGRVTTSQPYRGATRPYGNIWANSRRAERLQRWIDKPSCDGGAGQRKDASGADSPVVPEDWFHLRAQSHIAPCTTKPYPTTTCLAVPLLPSE